MTQRDLFSEYVDSLFDKPDPKIADVLERTKYPNAPGWTEPTTSKAAANSLTPDALTYQQRVIAEWLLRRGAIGAIREDIAEGCALRESSVCGRLVELCSAGIAVKLDRTAPTSSGRQAHVYVHKNHAEPKQCP